MMITKVHQLRSLSLIFLMRKKNSQIPWWDLSHDWRWPNKLIRFIARDMSVWVSYQASTAWRHSLFLIQDANFCHRPWRMRGKTALQIFLNNLKYSLYPNMLWFLSDEVRWWTHWATIVLLCLHKMCRYWWKLNTQFTSWCLGWSLTMVMLCYSSSHLASYSTWKAYMNCLKEVMLPRIKRLAAGRPYIWQQDSISCCTSKRTPSWLWENFCDHITPKFWPPNSPNCNLLDYYAWGTVEWETNKTLYNTKDELKARIMAVFTNLNEETVWKACRRFQSCLEAVVKANEDFF